MTAAPPSRVRVFGVGVAGISLGYRAASCSDDVRRIRVAAGDDEGRCNGGDGVHWVAGREGVDGCGS